MIPWTSKPPKVGVGIGVCLEGRPLLVLSHMERDPRQEPAARATVSPARVLREPAE